MLKETGRSPLGLQATWPKVHRSETEAEGKGPVRGWARAGLAGALTWKGGPRRFSAQLVRQTCRCGNWWWPRVRQGPGRPRRSRRWTGSARRAAAGSSQTLCPSAWCPASTAGQSLWGETQSTHHLRMAGPLGGSWPGHKTGCCRLPRGLRIPKHKWVNTGLCPGHLLSFHLALGESFPSLTIVCKFTDKKRPLNLQWPSP